MEYAIIAICLAVFGAIYYKQPKQLRNRLLTATLSEVKNRREELKDSSYDALPTQVKEKVDKETYEKVLDHALENVESVVMEKLK